MATQPYLDATRSGSFTTPAGWTALADAWEASAFDEVETQSWVEVEIEAPAVANILVARSITPEDVGLITPFFTPSNLPALEDAVGAIALIRGSQSGGLLFTESSTLNAVQAFFAKLSESSVSLTLDAPK